MISIGYAISKQKSKTLYFEILKIKLEILLKKLLLNYNVCISNVAQGLKYNIVHTNVMPELGTNTLVNCLCENILKLFTICSIQKSEVRIFAIFTLSYYIICKSMIHVDIKKKKKTFYTSVPNR